MQRLAAGALLAALALAAAAPPAPAPVPASVDLARAAWMLDGRPPPAAPPVLAQQDAPMLAELAFTRMGQRWACEFTTDAPQTRRLALRWQGAPDGLLFEVVLDGQRLSPPRDGWRPSPRPLASDLGGVWLGAGAHLLEFVAREKTPAEGARLRVAALELGEP
jgi:hypothetical protein